MAIDTALVADARAKLAASADPGRAPAMRAYMKSALPFHRVGSARVATIVREVVGDHPLAARDEWEATVRALYDEATHREERYVALGLARHRRYAAFRDPASMALWRHLVVTGAWWDLVDDVASHHVADVLARHRDAVTDELYAWATAEHLWLRRASIICQLPAKQATDLALLTYAIEANLEGTRFGGEFFVRKAIGWALRQHARTDPAWVRAFLAEHGARLSGLSRREAAKHLA